MFFPKDILIRKGKFGVIWLAATYNRPHMISKREYLAVNIPKSCHDITHPIIPFSLRLSCQLLVGVTRIYKKQMKYILDEFLQIAIRDMGRKSSLELANPVVRFDLITMSDPVERETMHFTVEPFHQDIVFNLMPPFHPGDGFLDLNGNVEIFQSPTKNSVRSSSSEMMTSPFQADLKDITMPDNAIPTDLPIVIPGEADFGPVLEDDLFELIDANRERRSRTTSRQNASTDVLTEQVGTAREPSRIGPTREGILQQHSEEIELPIEENIIAPQPATQIDAPVVETGDAVVSEAPKEKSWEEIAVTPKQPPLIRDAAMRPPKRRRLAIDREIKLSADDMRSRLADPHFSLKQVVLGGTKRLSANELFSQPAITYLATEYMAELWHHNARTFHEPNLHEDFWPADEDSSFESPDRVLRDGITPHSKEILRAANEMSTDFERSAGSTLTINPTPTSQQDSLTRRRASGVDRVTGRSTSGMEGELGAHDSRVLQRGLSPIPDERGGNMSLHLPMDDFVDDLVVPLEDIGEEEDLSDVSGAPSPKQEEFLRNLSDTMAGKNSVLFSEIALLTTSNRKAASRAFFNLLALKARQVIDAHQEESFGPIIIVRGRRF